MVSHFPVLYHQPPNDLKALNYALVLEHLEATYYSQGMNNFSASAFASAGYNASVYAYFVLIKDHEVVSCSPLLVYN